MRQVASCTLFASILAGSAPGAEREARADAASSCVLRGTAPLARGTTLFDTPSGGRAIATFTGALVPMSLRDLPSDPAGRARLATSNGGAALRLDGWAALASIPAYSARDLPIVEGHVWIASGHKVKLVKGDGATVTAELVIAGSQGQAVRASAPCDGLSLQRGPQSAMEVPGDGRGYLMKRSTLELFDRPQGASIFTLRMMDGAVQLFWSTESRGGFVHLRGRGDLMIDAWARAGDLQALKKGEMLDQLVPPTTSVAGAQLALDKPPPLVRATKEIPLRARRDATEAPIGAIEPGAEVFLVETVGGWINVLPKGLGMTPAEGGGFWIPAADAPK